jgi:hypothetical protein
LSPRHADPSPPAPCSRAPITSTRGADCGEVSIYRHGSVPSCRPAGDHRGEADNRRQRADLSTEHPFAQEQRGGSQQGRRRGRGAGHPLRETRVQEGEEQHRNREREEHRQVAFQPFGRGNTGSFDHAAPARPCQAAACPCTVSRLINAPNRAGPRRPGFSGPWAKRQREGLLRMPADVFWRREDVTKRRDLHGRVAIAAEHDVHPACDRSVVSARAHESSCSADERTTDRRQRHATDRLLGTRRVADGHR